LPIETVHVENALVEVLNLDSSIQLLDIPWTSDRILTSLENYNLKKLFPMLLTELEFDHSILPSHIPRSLTEQTIRCNGETWRVHRNDPDPFPSNPHAHNLESRLRLHLGTGELFDKRRVVEKISRKDLLDIRLKNFDLPELDF
jgi:hypothetical protein